MHGGRLNHFQWHHGSRERALRSVWKILVLHVVVCADLVSVRFSPNPNPNPGLWHPGASTGIYEAHEWRDGGDRYNGKGETLINVRVMLGCACEIELGVALRFELSLCAIIGRRTGRRESHQQ